MENRKIASELVRIARSLMGASDWVDVPEEFVEGAWGDDPRSVETVQVRVTPDKIEMKAEVRDGKRISVVNKSFPNEWRAGWHNGVARFLQIPMSKNRAYRAWAEAIASN
jgi:hypothetical protein